MEPKPSERERRLHTAGSEILLAVLLVAGAEAACLGQERNSASPAAGFTIRADWSDRGNIRVSTLGESYADKFACIWNAGELPNWAEYDLDFPVTADYTIAALYAAHSPRPVEVYLDGEKIVEGFTSATGGWQTSHARWETQGTVRIIQGRHTVKLHCAGPMPHICALRFESAEPFPEGWKLARPAAREVEKPPAPAIPAEHFLLESAFALGDAPPLQVQIVRRGEAEWFGEAAHNELLSQVEGPDDADWAARLSFEPAPVAKREATLPLSPSTVRKLLDQVLELIADHRTRGVAGRDFLAGERGEAVALAAVVDRLLTMPDDDVKWKQFADAYLAAYRLKRRVALANPLLDFERLLLVRRGVNHPHLGLPYNWQSNCVLPRSGFDDDIAVLSIPADGSDPATLYRPAGSYFVGDLELHFDADRLMFSSIGQQDRWHVFEIGVDGTGLRQVTPGGQPDVDHYDACYLPDGGILFTSTATMVAVPCVNGSTRVANLYRMDPDGRIRLLCFDQEHNWCPTLLPDGRVLYQRWEYADTPHAHARLLFSMNPDGTRQMEYYGSNSYWPNSMFYARPIPGHPTKFVTIVGGHHGNRRKGELTVFDIARGRREAEGAVQQIPGRGRPVEARIEDNLVDASWPKFLHPYPLSDKHFLVAAKPAPESLWGIYLVDVFDNMTLLKEQPGYALFEPTPVRPRPVPPAIPNRVDLDQTEATVEIIDIYAGDGLAGIPRGEVKSLRLLSYHYLYPGMGGPQGVVGMEGPWDIKRIVGTVPVEDDGSALFRVPANMPLAVQPLDAEGKALALMRSWFVGMPGEVVSCVGCHENPNESPPIRHGNTRAYLRPPSVIKPWYGPTRGFSFEREVQPVLDRYCIGCHNGSLRSDVSAEGDSPIFAAKDRSLERESSPPRKLGQSPANGYPADLRGLERITDYTSVYHYGAHDAGHFSTSYVELHRFVRRPGLESDYRLLVPMEYHADTTDLVKLLAKGHYGVALDAESWDRLITWIDLNAPFHGTWTEIAGAERVAHVARRRRELLKLYAGVDDDPETIPPAAVLQAEPMASRPVAGEEAAPIELPGWPFDASEARRRQEAAGPAARTVDLGGGLSMDLVRIPAGEFVMGEATGLPDEGPRSRVSVTRSFWMGRFEVTNEQFARFDPAHDSRVESKHAMQFGVRGFYVNGPRQPVVRVSWRQAMAFCEWLSRRTGEYVTLPTEAQWEYACRAGTQTPFFYGDLDTDFSPFANLADAMLREFVCHPYKKDRTPYPEPSKYDDWIPKDERFNDGGFLSEEVGRYRPNPWGLHDMHGNVAEWTLSAYRPYPYDDGDGRNHPNGPEPRVVRGGSWYDRPRNAPAAHRTAYRPYQPVYNVGFRVVIREE
ncbi:MAG: SUMF1/EgtB/PvdO family nonheme iron enzyme [Thermoguttaceae bacterium]|jgi:formylglycine-generating enzyme required for sulfatase activity|nr:SUMF1/EgtB/PvdO family nonheme iron enzyme [Thermoguttaceae bacterium]